MTKKQQQPQQKANDDNSKPIKVGFFHPDLGIGGAERLVVDAAMALRSKGCDVTMYTSHHDPNHCFPETAPKTGSLPVEVYGDWLPRKLFGRFHVLFAVLRAVWLALRLSVLRLGGANKLRDLDVAFVDQVSAPVPLIKLLSGGRTKVLFYCHFPDKLLATRTVALQETKVSLAKRIYRVPFDKAEEWTTGKADKILVNSNFTAGVFSKTFAGLAAPEVLYPSINMDAFARSYAAAKKFKEAPSCLHDVIPGIPDDVTNCATADVKRIVLSINRFERKKNIMLAVEMLAYLRNTYPDAFARTHLVIAGGYDPRVAENVEYKKELDAKVAELGLERNVTMVLNFTDDQRAALLALSACLVYTPQNEHFGIVPVEAMFSYVPVVAANSGGPCESVADGFTGFLCDPKPEAFADKVARIVTDEALAAKMGEAAHKRTIEMFSFESFTDQLYSVVESLVSKKKKTN